jgi:hypothetical protein
MEIGWLPTLDTFSNFSRHGNEVVADNGAYQANPGTRPVPKSSWRSQSIHFLNTVSAPGLCLQARAKGLRGERERHLVLMDFLAQVRS